MKHFFYSVFWCTALLNGFFVSLVLAQASGKFAYTSDSRITHDKQLGMIVCHRFDRSDTMYSSVFQNEIFWIDSMNVGFVGSNKVYLLTGTLTNIDSFSSPIISSIDGFNYCSERKLLTMWQKQNGIFDNYYVPQWKNVESIILNNGNILDMNFNASIGFVFTMSGYLKDSNTLKIYPANFDGIDLNKLHQKKQRVYNIGTCHKIVLLDSDKIVVSGLNANNEVIERVFYPYKRRKRFWIF